MRGPVFGTGTWPKEWATSLKAHDEIKAAARDREADTLVRALNAHRERALTVLGALPSEPAA